MSHSLQKAAIVALTCFLGVGCHSMRHSQTPIVGDSMSLGMGCGADGCGAPQDFQAEYPPAYVAEGIPGGCCGDHCDGRCGGRCPLAGRMAGALRQMPHPLANAMHCSHQRCANGVCGGTPGPEMGQVTYPYYTLRGPRDFFLANPPSIGP